MGISGIDGKVATGEGGGWAVQPDPRVADVRRWDDARGIRRSYPGKQPVVAVDGSLSGACSEIAEDVGPNVVRVEGGGGCAVDDARRTLDGQRLPAGIAGLRVEDGAGADDRVVPSLRGIRRGENAGEARDGRDDAARAVRGRGLSGKRRH